MKTLLCFFFIYNITVNAQVNTKEEMNFFDTKKAILAEIDKRLAIDPNNKKLIENRKCIETTKSHADLKFCKEKLKAD